MRKLYVYVTKRDLRRLCTDVIIPAGSLVLSEGNSRKDGYLSCRTEEKRKKWEGDFPDSIDYKDLILMDFEYEEL